MLLLTLKGVKIQVTVMDVGREQLYQVKRDRK